MSQHYEPLHLPEAATRRRSLKDWIDKIRWLGFSHKKRSLHEQMEARSSLPPEVWGPSQERRQFASEISEIIRDRFYWPNAHFQPEDPFDLVLFVDEGSIDGLDIDETLMQIEEDLLDCELTSEVWDSLWELSFGEVVDALAEIRAMPDKSSVRRKKDVIPLHGPEALEANPCPALATFLDMRDFLRGQFELAGSLRPSTRIAKALPLDAIHALDGYIKNHFQTKTHLWSHYTLRDTLACGVAGTMVLVAAFTALTTFHGNPHGLALSLPILLLGMVATLGIAFTRTGFYWFSRTYWARLFGRKPNLLTFADLVRHIIAERQRLAQAG